MPGEMPFEELFSTKTSVVFILCLIKKITRLIFVFYLCTGMFVHCRLPVSRQWIFLRSSVLLNFTFCLIDCRMIYAFFVEKRYG